MKCPKCNEEEYVQIGNNYECMECNFKWEECVPSGDEE